ncbi:uncharacterized protein [Apostichopus japonicus]|uniref:uncharacterized protein isoform X3 n=1 Tax=Stichopus japonicus TaxID=307972 RepID=UPI003AB262C6
MKDSCEVDMENTSMDVANGHATTNPLDPTLWKAKPLSTNGVLVAVVSAIVVTCMFVTVNSIEQNNRIALLETELQTHRELIRNLQESVARLRGNLYGKEEEDAIDATEALDGHEEDVITREQSRKAQPMDDVNKFIIPPGRQYSPERRKALSPGVRRSNLSENENRASEPGRRFKRTAATTPTPTRKKKKTAKSERRRNGPNTGRPNKQRKRDRESSNESVSCDLLQRCNGTLGRNRGESIMAHFELDNDSDHLVSARCRHDVFNPHYVSCDDEILSDWHYANWMPNPGAGRRSFRIKHHGSLRKAKVEVIEPGIYYLYSQVSFADTGAYLAYSIMIEDQPKFTCRLFLSADVVDSNSCMTGGMMKIDAGQTVHIELAERNKVISMDKESTYFGMIRMSPLDD